MTLARSVADVLSDHVTLEVESIDRMYLNLYVPKLQYEMGVVGFFRGHRGATFASSALMDPITKDFVADIHRFVKHEGVDLVTFEKGQRKDDVAQEYRAGFEGEEGVLFVGKAQEKTTTFRTEKRTNPETGRTYPWIVRATALVNQYYFYCVDADFGPFFIKFGSYFLYNGKLCLNGNEWAKCQAAKSGIDFEPLDNGFASCSDPKHLQRICDRLGPKKIDALARTWFARLPHPFTFARVCTPVIVDGQRGPALRFGDPRVQALFSALVVFRRLPRGFSNRDVRSHLAPLLGIDPSVMTAGRMTYDLRRLRLHGIIERIPHSHRYQVTPFGLKTAIFFTRTHNRLLRTGLSEICDPVPMDAPLRRQFDRLEHTITDLVANLGLAA
jgi:hypothetical protein